MTNEKRQITNDKYSRIEIPSAQALPLMADVDDQARGIQEFEDAVVVRG
jgi:hypothetical protein